MKIVKQNFSRSPELNAIVSAESISRDPRKTPGHWSYGTVQAVEPSRKLLLLKLPVEDEEQLIRWMPQTRFLSDGAEVGSTVLHGGQRIAVEYLTDDGSNFALQIDIIGEPAFTELDAS